MKRIVFASVTLIIALFFTGCKKEDVAPIEVAEVTMSQEIAEIEVGSTLQLAASVTPTNADDKTVIWSSTKNSVATVSKKGLVAALKEGKTTITAMAGSKTATCEVTVVKATIPVSGIELSEKEIVLFEGENKIISARILPDDASDKSVLWESEDPNTATVNEGEIKAIKSGKTQIIAKSVDGGKIAKCVVIVEKKPDPSVSGEVISLSSVSAQIQAKANIDKITPDIEYGVMYATSASILVANPTACKSTEHDTDFNYSVSISKLSPETTYYYRSYLYQAGENYYGETKSFKTNNISSLIYSKDASNIEAASATISAILCLKDVAYSSIEYGFVWGTTETSLLNKERISTIQNDIISTTLSSLAHNTQYWYCPYVVIDGNEYKGEIMSFCTGVIHVNSVSLNESTKTINKLGEKFTLAATVLPEDATNKEVTWSSDKPDVASVDNGVVLAKSAGTAIISVTSKDGGKVASCEVTVYQAAEDVSFDITSRTINEGESFVLKASVMPNSTTDKSLVWESADEAIAKVDQSGKVTAVSKGSTTIKATTQDGSNKSAICTVMVNRLVSQIQIEQNDLVLNVGASEMLSATVLPTTATNREIEWESSSPSIATVSSNGLVTGVARGNTTIIAKATDGSGITASCSVEVKQPVTCISLNRTGISCIKGKTEKVSVLVEPENANNKAISFSSSNESVATVDANGNVTSYALGKATIYVTAQDGSGVSSQCVVSVWDEPDIVDLGLSVKWSSWNIGASDPSGLGDLFSWGEIYGNHDGKDNFDFYHYKWFQGERHSYNGTFGLYPETILKYNWLSDFGSIDNKTVLDLEDDAAYVKLGGSWRMPTFAEFTELRNKCTWVWTTVNGVAGYKITSNVSGYKDISIFLPAAGFSVNTQISGNGQGLYWSSTLRPGLSYDHPQGAGCITFSSGNFFLQGSNRAGGLSIRAVCN